MVPSNGVRWLANAAPPPTPATTTERPEIRTARVIRRRDTNITNHCNRPVSHSAFKDRRVISDLVISIHATPQCLAPSERGHPENRRVASHPSGGSRRRPRPPHCPSPDRLHGRIRQADRGRDG